MAPLESGGGNEVSFDTIANSQKPCEFDDFQGRTVIFIPRLHFRYFEWLLVGTCWAISKRCLRSSGGSGIFVSVKQKTLTNSGEGNAMEWVFYAGVCLFFFLVSLILIGLGCRDFLANKRAMTWKPALARITNCESSLQKERHEDDPGVTWHLTCRLTYEYSWGGKTFRNFFSRGKKMGEVIPDQEQVASVARDLREGYGDGFTVMVNPDSPGESMVEPSVAGPILVLVMGFVLLGVAFFLTRVSFQKKGPQEPDE